MNLKDILPELLLPVAELLLCTLFGYLGIKLRALYVRTVNNREKEAVARTVVGAVEQLCRDLHGKDKLNAALDRMIALLSARSISVTVEEATLLLESAVAEFNRAFADSAVPTESAIAAS